MRPDDLHDDENWTGGFYELSLTLEPAGDDLLDRAVRALWRAAGVEGCLARRPDGTFAAVEPGAAALHAHGHLRGRVTLPAGDRVVCGGFVSRFDGADHLELYLPLGALARVDRRIGGFPFDERSGAESLDWRAPIDRWLAAVAAVVHAEVPIRHGLVGFEIDEVDDLGEVPPYTAVLVPSGAGLDHRPAYG
ncbi:hypothetical protein [Spirilliplanes yamanashiensis]|uniref:Uncharacterized protein n=1 Tax=Spirilliplanes yamanashiensis TaxID=42233 RepID=A0A8J3Y920_9ACTN|nr:hypothetical protein [Spirilliplanes yamanashiensis]MDP9816899.1 hypothetical protein [Spirilliplanes yamanashiensis]GIJ03445.1 hypothetical protein Sya03_27970 [Spirilliplanes yamanashiensis]